MTRSQAIAFFRWIALIGIYGGLLVPLMFIPVVIFPFVFSKLIYFQVLVGLTFPAYLALAWMEPKYRPKKHLLYFAILAYFVALALSVIFAVDPARAWWGNQERMNGLFTLLHFFAWMTMATGVLQKWEDWKKLLIYEVSLSGVMAIVAIMQRLKPDLLLFTAGGRVGGLVDNPIYMAAYQIFNFFFLALLIWKIPSNKWRAFFGVIFVLDAIAFLLAASRGALVGLAAGLFAFAVYVSLFSKSKKVRFSIFGVLAVLVLGYGLVYSIRETPIIKNSPIYRLTDLNTTVSTRLIAWEIAWQGFLERPLTGWGLDNFHILFNNKYNPVSLRFGTYETWFDRAHNTVMDVLAMTGIAGFVTFFSIFVAVFLSSIKAFRKGWIDLPIAAILFSLPIAYFVQNLFVFDHPAGFSMSFLLYALIIAATRGEFVGDVSKAEVKAETEARTDTPWTAFVVLQVIMALVVWRTSVLPFQASRISLQSNAIIMSNPTVGFALAKQASEIPTMYLDEQSFLLSRNLIAMYGNGVLQKIPNWQEMYALAKKLSEDEITRHPRNTHPKFIYARMAQEIMMLQPSEAPVAEIQYKAAIETSPKRQQLHYGLARLYLQTGNLDPAITVFRNVAEFDPENGEPFWNLGLTLFYDKRAFQEGAEYIQKSQTAKFKYRMMSAREFVPLVEALLFLNDEALIKEFITNLANPDHYIPGTADVYAQLAYRLQQANKNELRDQLLAEAVKVAPTTVDAFNALLIQASAAPAAAPVATETAPASAPVPSAPVATNTVPSSGGPRR